MHRLLFFIFLTTALLEAQDQFEPADLVNLRASWQRAVSEATSPLNKKYLDALNAMKQRYTKDGNLEAALKVDSEIKALSSVAESPDKENETAPEVAPEGQRLSSSERKRLLSYFVGKTWEFTGEGKSEWFYFDEKGGGRRLVADGSVNSKLEWDLKPDGVLEMWGAGYTKKTRFVTSDSATVIVILRDGTPVVGWTAKPSDKLIPEE